MKKILLFSIFSFIVLSFFSSAEAMTAAEKQNLIYQIQQQIMQLQAELSAQNSAGSSLWCHDFNTSLSLGNTGAEVINLQNALNKEGLLNSNNVNGNFDTATYSAVVLFQEKYKSEVLTPFGLKSGTGKIGAATKTKLNKLYSCSLIANCAPNWTCSDWGSCSGGKQSRKCSDVKNCNTTFAKPTETQPCTIPSVKISGNNIHGAVSINSGESANISWTAANVLFCNASGNWTGIKNISGLESTGPLTSSKIYNISCTDASKKVVTDTLTVNVVMPTVSIKANGTSKSITIASGKAATLNWTAIGVKSCFASGDWLGDRSLSGSESTGFLPYAKQYVYGITCSGTTGNISDVVYVNVSQPTVNIKANGTHGTLIIASGKPVSLTWTSSGVLSCSALGNWQGAKSVSGSESIGNVYANSFYILNCIDSLGNTIGDSVSVNIK